MTKEIITVHVQLDAEAFRRFAVFDNLLLRRRWGRPVVFCILMTIFAAVCFWLRREQSALIGSVLLLVGFGMPLVYFGTFFHQIQTQVKKLRLKTPQAFYTLRLGPEGVRITNDRKTEAAQELPWEKVYAAYRVRGSVYLYATPARAFLLPDGQADASPEELWQLLTRHMEAKRLFAGTDSQHGISRQTMSTRKKSSGPSI